MDFILTAVMVLGGIALIAAVVLYVCSKKFAVKEDPRVGQVIELHDAWNGFAPNFNRLPPRGRCDAEASHCRDSLADSSAYVR